MPFTPFTLKFIYVAHVTHIFGAADKQSVSEQNCTACQYSPLRQKFMECSIINPALSL